MVTIVFSILKITIVYLRLSQKLAAGIKITSSLIYRNFFQWKHHTHHRIKNTLTNVVGGLDIELPL